MKRLVAIIFIVVVLLIVGAAPVSAAGHGPPDAIRNYTDTPGEVVDNSQDQGPPNYILIWLPAQGYANNPHGSTIYIDPTNSPAD